MLSIDDFDWFQGVLCKRNTSTYLATWEYTNMLYWPRLISQTAKAKPLSLNGGD